MAEINFEGDAVPILGLARVIAAAPQMLLELEHELEELEAWLRDEDLPDYMREAMRIRQKKIQEVVRLAKGEVDRD